MGGVWGALPRPTHSLPASRAQSESELSPSAGGGMVMVGWGDWPGVGPPVHNIDMVHHTGTTNYLVPFTRCRTKILS